MSHTGWSAADAHGELAGLPRKLRAGAELFGAGCLLSMLFAGALILRQLRRMT